MPALGLGVSLLLFLAFLLLRALVVPVEAKAPLLQLHQLLAAFVLDVHLSLQLDAVLWLLASGVSECALLWRLHGALLPFLQHLSRSGGGRSRIVRDQEISVALPRQAHHVLLLLRPYLLWPIVKVVIAAEPARRCISRSLRGDHERVSSLVSPVIAVRLWKNEPQL